MLPTLTLRRAEPADLPTIVRLFAIPDEGNLKDEDPSSPLPSCYAEALASIATDPRSMLMVAESDGAVIGAFHLTILQYVAYRGGRVAQIENVIVEPGARRLGVGAAMMTWAIDEARRQGCFRVQLTSNKARTRAHRFYERLGFRATHEGMKLALR
ncbi:MAG: GNAT family N-acetyltransferase [Byssovorax sp.]